MKRLARRILPSAWLYKNNSHLCPLSLCWYLYYFMYLALQPWERSNMSLELRGRWLRRSTKRQSPGLLPLLFIRVEDFWGWDNARMLKQLIELLEQKENGLSLVEISHAMKAQPSAVMAMIKLLVQ